MLKQIPYGRHDITTEDIEAVTAVLRSDWLTQGPSIEAFEKKVAEQCGAQYAVAVSNATCALHLACLAAGMGRGDILWTSPNTFVASANCALYCDSDVDFVDIDPISYNMSVHQLSTKLDRAQGKLPKVIVPVHFSGQSCEMKEIFKLAQSAGALVIEDASHAVGGSYLGSRIGSCKYSDMTVFSFHPVKILTTAEGGMILTNREDLYRRLTLLRTHGITRDPAMMSRVSEGPWYYEQIDLGFNYRMTDLQAALGIAQMSRLDNFVERRHYLANRYFDRLARLDIILPKQNKEAHSAFHLFVIKLKLDQIKKSRKQVFEELRQAGIGVNVHYIPVHTHPYYQKRGFKWGDFPEAEAYYESAITLPLYYGLTEDDQDRVISVLQEIIR